MAKIVIADSYWDTHGIYIKYAIQSIYTTLTDDDFVNVNSLSEAITYANENSDVVAIIESYTSSSSYYTTMQSLYLSLNKRVLFFAPLGGNINIFQEVNIYPTNSPKVIVTSGAGDEELRNNTSYGKGLEFWDWDLTQTFPTPTPDQSSYSNGIVLGKLLKIKDTLNCSWWEARYRARATADRIEPNRNNIDTITGIAWCKYNGFGRINVNNAIAYTGSIPDDPYREHIGTVGTLNLTINDDYITILCGRIDYAQGYEIQKLTDNGWEDCSVVWNTLQDNWNVIVALYSTIELETTVNWDSLNTYTFRYRGMLEYNGIVEYSEWAESSIVVSMSVGTIAFSRPRYSNIDILADSIDNCDSYEIYKDEGAGYTRISTTNSYTDTDTLNKRLKYKYRGKNDSNNVYSIFSNEFEIVGNPAFQKLKITLK